MTVEHGAVDDVDRLYELPLDQFVAERDALARRLKQAGDADAAAEVKALRKPTATAWAANQLVRSERPAVDALLRAGEELRSAQRQALSRGSGGTEAFRAAIKAHRQAVSDLLRAAAAVGVRSADLSERLAATLQATATSQEAAEALRRGCLSTDLDASGFGDAGALALVGEPETGARRGEARAAKAGGGAARRKAGDTERRKADEEARRKADREAGRQRAAELLEAAERSAAEAGLLAAEADRLEAAAREARKAADAAHRTAVRARAAADRAVRARR